MSYFVHTLVPTLWLCWVAVWVVAARGVKQTARYESLRSRLSHHVPLIAGAALLCFPNNLNPRLEQNFVPQTPVWLCTGAALVVLGLGFAITARAWLGGNWSSSVTLKRGHELIRSGPYALVRHPIYSGLLLAVAGTAITIGKWRALIGLALMLAAIIRKMMIEERFMAEQFGDAYARYRHDVAALIPFIV